MKSGLKCSKYFTEEPSFKYVCFLKDFIPNMRNYFDVRHFFFGIAMLLNGMSSRRGCGGEEFFISLIREISI